MPSTSKKVIYDDLAFLVDENVYEPAEDSFLFAENLPNKEFCRVADVGTGCGILSILVAPRAREIVAVDLNPYAVRCARQNAKLNGVVEKIVFIQGDLLSSIDKNVKFDLILFNAPYLPLERGGLCWLERSWAGGKDGREIIDRFLDETTGYLNHKGQILLLQSSLSNVDLTLRRFAGKGFISRVVVSRNLPFFETIVLISAEPIEEPKI